MLSCLALCFCVFFSVLFSIVITSLGLGKRKLVCMLLMHLFVYFAHINFCPFSSSWCQGLTAACDCGTSWTFNFFSLNYHLDWFMMS